MEQRPQTAGGFFLILAILVGFGIGAAMGQVVIGTLLGTAAGILLAILVWLRDRRAA